MPIFQATPYLLPLLATALISVVISVIAWRRRERVPGAQTVTALMHANAVWAVLYALELSTPRLEWQILLAKGQYIGILSIPGLWLLFTIQYARRDESLTRLRRALFYAMPLAFLLLVWTNDWHGLVWPQVHQSLQDGAMVLDLEHGPGFYAIIIYSYINLLAGTMLLVITYFSAPALYRRQVSIILLGAAAPWIGNALYVLNLTPYGRLDLTPFGFTISGMAATWGLLRYGLLELIPLARNEVIERLNEAVIAADLQGRILDLNPAARRLIGAMRPDSSAAANAAVKPDADNLLGMGLEQALPLWPELLKHSSHDDLALPLAGEIRYFGAQVSPVQTFPGKNGGYLLVLSDITGRRQAEDALREARDLAESASNAKSAFLATMSHELRTPLTVIIGYSEMLLEEAQQSGEPQTALRLSRIEGASKHLLALVNDVLDLSKIEAGRMQLDCIRFTVSEVLEEALGLGRPLAERRGNQLEVSLPAEAGEMFSDPTRVRQVLINLLSNATRFTHNGRIRLSVERYNTADGRTWLAFEVSDSGVGMSPEQMAGLFQPFYQVVSTPGQSAGGAGLGLAISRRLCQILGGDITVRSSPNQGSTFTVRLPAVAPGQLERTPAAAPDGVSNVHDLAD